MCGPFAAARAMQHMRRAAIGFKGLALAPVTENTLTSYAASAGEALPYAGSMSRTAKESTTDLYYDDDLYAQIKNVSGEDVEIRVAEVPLERMAGVDVCRIKEKYPQLLMLGGFDKPVMHKGEAAIRAEFERILPAIRSGRYIPSVDHQTPPAVSVEDYKLYMSILREYSQKIGK